MPPSKCQVTCFSVFCRLNAAGLTLPDFRGFLSAGLCVLMHRHGTENNTAKLIGHFARFSITCLLPGRERGEKNGFMVEKVLIGRGVMSPFLHCIIPSISWPYFEFHSLSVFHGRCPSEMSFLGVPGHVGEERCRHTACVVGYSRAEQSEAAVHLPSGWRSLLPKFPALFLWGD